MASDPHPRTDEPSRGESPGRVLLALTTYRACDPVETVLRDALATIGGSPRFDVIVIADGIGAASAGLGDRVRAIAGDRPVRVLRTPTEMGPGGTQKLVHRHAIDGGHALVVHLPADGQYRGADVPALVSAWERGRPAVVLGSRLSAGGRGLPWFRRTANRFVSSFQNRIVGRSIADYHTGLRAYDVAFMGRVPFELHTNRGHFDTEMLLQAIHAGEAIVEVPVEVAADPTARRESRIRYALASLRATARLRAHRMGFFCSLLYRETRALRYEDKGDDLYSSHAVALRVVRDLGARTLLDIGCGPGHVARRFTAMGFTVTGIDREDPQPGSMSAFHRVRLDRDPFPVDPFGFDAVLLLDVIEHLPDPERFLVSLRNGSERIPSDGTRPALILSTPNIAFASIRLQLLMGGFNYAERGILDIDHKRLFTRRSLLRAMRDCGYEVERVVPVGVPFAAVLRSRTGRVLGRIAGWMARAWPTMFAFQFVLVARPLPGIAQVLRESEVAADAPSGPKR